MSEVSAAEIKIKPCDFAALPRWSTDDHGAAFRTFLRSAVVLAERPPKARGMGVDANALGAILARARTLDGDLSQDRARRFFETEFEAFEVVPATRRAFFTGYYEPVVAGSRKRTRCFQTPLYGVPDDLVEFDPEAPPEGMEPALRFVRKSETGLVPYYDRAAIAAGALAGRGLELVFLADPIDAFFIHVQGAARIALAEGGTMRVTYAAKSGQPYTAIGRVLIEMGELEQDRTTMADIRAWLAAHREAAETVMARNRSFIFFRETPVGDPALGPVGAAKVPMTAGRSLAVDRLLYPFHMPVWIEARLPDGGSLQRLMIAQDTGSAIVGHARGDIFFGSGDAAGAVAGGVASEGRFVLLAPRGSRLGEAALS